MIRQLEVVHLGIQVHFVDQLHAFSPTCGVKGNQVTFTGEIKQGFSDFLINQVLVGDINGHGKLPFTDKADPERIKAEMGMSKAAFKRAVGRLLKQKKIVIKEDGIYSL